MTKRDKLQYYLDLPYTIEIIPDKEDGGWFVQIKELEGCMTQADSWEEILPMIQEAKELWLEVALEHNTPIPEPSGVLGAVSHNQVIQEA